MSGVADGARASQWDDISGNSRHAVQASGSIQPTKRDAAVGGLAAFDFTPGLSYFEVPDMSAIGDGEAFIYAKLDADPGDNNGSLIHTGNYNSPDIQCYGDGNIYDGYGSTARKTCGDPTDPLDSWFLLDLKSILFEYTARVNGSVLFTTATNTPSYTTTPTIGCGSLVFPNFLKGRIAEVVLLGAALTTGDRTAMEGYFAAEYGGGGGGGGGGTPPSGAVTINWANRNRLTPHLIKQSAASETPESGQTTTVKIYGQDGTTLLHTESGLTGTTFNYTAVNELADSGITDLQTSLTFVVTSARDGYVSNLATKILTR